MQATITNKDPAENDRLLMPSKYNIILDKHYYYPLTLTDSSLKYEQSNHLEILRNIYLQSAPPTTHRSVQNTVSGSEYFDYWKP